MSDQIIASASKNTFDRDYRELNILFVEIDKEVNNFANILEAFKDNKEKLILEIETLANRLKGLNYDYMLIRITTPVYRKSFDKPIVETYLEYLKYYKVDTKSTVNQQIEWFYNHVLVYALKFNMLMMSCYGVLKEHSTGKLFKRTKLLVTKP